MPTSMWLILENVRESPESRFHQDLRLLGASSCSSNKQRGDQPCPSPGDRRHSGRPRRPNLPSTCRVQPCASGARLLQGAGGSGPRRFPRAQPPLPQVEGTERKQRQMEAFLGTHRCGPSAVVSRGGRRDPVCVSSPESRVRAHVLRPTAHGGMRSLPQLHTCALSPGLGWLKGGPRGKGRGARGDG